MTGQQEKVLIFIQFVLQLFIKVAHALSTSQPFVVTTCIYNGSKFKVLIFQNEVIDPNL